MSQGPDFNQKIKETLAKRAGQVCSNPDCRRPTSGPHSEGNKAINLGEAAHIKAARMSEARYDPNMTDEERGNISNGIWLCRECARKIDLDEKMYTLELLYLWKKRHEDFIASGKPPAIATRELTVRDGGIASVIQNAGDGIGLDIIHSGKGPAERITVEGSGIGEIITNTGQGIGKRITSTGGESASETRVVIDKDVKMAAGSIATTVIMSCSSCGYNFVATKVIQGFAGNSEPKVKVNCPHCGATMLI
jgi:transposase-like protein